MRIEVVHGEEPKDAYQELVEDLIAILTSFADKLYGMRSHRKKRLVEEFKKLLEEVEKNEQSSSVVVESNPLPRCLESLSSLRACTGTWLNNWYYTPSEATLRA